MASNDIAAAVLQWAQIRAQLQQEVGDIEYRTWLKQMSLGDVSAEEVTVHLPSRFLRDWVRSHYGDRISDLWRAQRPGLKRVDIRVGTTHGAFAESVSPLSAGGMSGGERVAGAPANATASAAGAGAGLSAAPVMPGRYAGQMAPVEQAFSQNPFAAGATGPRGGDEAALDQRFTFENFVVGKPNEFAYACARRVAERPACAGFNPLFLYGGVGLGKTHLMHAIGIELMRSGRPVNVAYMSAEKFMYRFIAALRGQATIEFKGQLRSVDVLMIDDLQFLIGKDSTQEEFFHTFNALIDAGKQIVVSADKSPSDLSGIEDRLRTRLGCGMVADLHSTTFELRISILQSKAQRTGVDVPERVLELLAHKITGNVRELEGALNRLIAHANLFSRTITLETAQEVLHDVLRAHDRRVSIDEIQKRVAEHYNMRITDMVSARRARAVARPRQVAMYLAKQLTSRSLPEIGKKFGGRDHTTVMHAVTRVSELMQKEQSFAEDVELLRRMLEG